MTRRNFTVALALSTAPLWASAGEPAQARAEAARQNMARATTFMRSIATEGGYVYKYAPDLSRRTAERPATPTQIAIQPPGTPSMGLTFLRAYAVTRSSLQLEAARGAAEALRRCQLGSGGWNRIADFDPARPNEDGRLHTNASLTHSQVIQHTLYTTFDDDTTQSAIRFLVAWGAATKDSQDPRDRRIAAARDRALRGMLAAQYPTGAWPQRYSGEAREPGKYPVKKADIPQGYPRSWPDADYTRYYTVNDNCQSTCIKTMLDAFQVLGRPEHLESATRGADFLLLAQLPEPQPGWAQQYNFNMEPAWARVMEPPAVSSAESGKVIDALLDIHLETGHRKFLDTAASAVAWLQRSALRPKLWARLYELGSNRPIYGDERGGIFYSRAELSAKFARDYNWESAYKIPQVIARYEDIKRRGREVVRAEAMAEKEEMAALEARVDQAVASCDNAGRWITPDRWKKGSPLEDFISTRIFIAQMNTLADYLARIDAGATREAAAR